MFTVLIAGAAGWLGGLTAAGFLWLLILYFGGPGLPVPWLRPRRYRRINKPRRA